MPRSLNQIMTNHAYRMAKVCQAQLVQFVAGEPMGERRPDTGSTAKMRYLASKP